MSSQRPIFPVSLLLMVLAGTCVTLPVVPGVQAQEFSSVKPTYIAAGTFYVGSELQVRGTIDAHSQVAIRVLGPPSPQTFNRRAKIAGLIWGGIEHVTFERAPSLFFLFTSATPTVMADPATRREFKLGYESLEAHIDVEGTQADKREMIVQFVRLKEKEGLYHVAAGSVHLGDAQKGGRDFSVSIPLPAAVPPGDIEVTVLELANGRVVRQNRSPVKIERVGIPAFFAHLAHERSLTFGFFTLFVLVGTGVSIGVLGRPRSARLSGAATGSLQPDTAARAEQPGPFSLIVHEAKNILLGQRPHLGSPKDLALLHKKYDLFRTLLGLNNELLELLAELEEESSWTSFRHPRVRMGIRALFDGTQDMVQVLNELSDNRYFDLSNVIAGIRRDVSEFFLKAPEQEDSRITLPLAEIDQKTAGRVGGKAVNLARLECDLKLLVPDSLAITVEAYRLLLEADGLASKIRTLLAPARLDAAEDFRQRCEMAQEMIEGASVPPAVAEAIHRALRGWHLAPQEGVAVRSSATGEDSELSFAGQFETFLNVPEAEVARAWKKVIRSRFAPKAVFYRRAAGLAEVDTPMAVLVQRMIRPVVSGVLYTQQPENPKRPAVLISSAPGLGVNISMGIASADEYLVSRQSPHRVLERRLSRKVHRLESAGGGGLTEIPVASERQLEDSITDPEAGRLAQMGLAIERYFGRPQDIEWAIDGEGKIFVLQARPLRTVKPESAGPAVPSGAPLLLKGGNPVWPGRAVGRVFVPRTKDDEERLPTGALLVTQQLLPDCVRFLPRVCGVIVEKGSVTGHAASILREFRVPSLFGVAGAVEKLVADDLVSLDAAEGCVYAGVLWPELLGRPAVSLRGRRSLGMPDLLASKLTRLSGSAFIGSWTCQSLHDVIRFAHEMAVQSMFDIGDRILKSHLGGVKRLDCSPSVFMHILDLGGGMRPEAAAHKRVTPGEVISLPFRALWRGLGNEEFERQWPGAPHLSSFASVVSGSMASGGERDFGAPNYACVAENYLNLNSREIFHFAMVDSFLSENPNNNHISIRFKGGGAAPWQRNLRAEFIAEVLKLHGFTVNVRGDLVNGWCHGLDLEPCSDQLTMIGRLLRFSKRLDMYMRNEEQIREYLDSFVKEEAMASMGLTPGSSSH
jgi:pyruvate,water dikinase